MTSETRRLAGLLMVILPTVMIGGVNLAYVGGLVLAAGVVTLGVGLIRAAGKGGRA